jgi:hypothetical protein
LLAEAFTPSTIRRLEKAVNDLPAPTFDRRRELLERLGKSRSPTHGRGWTRIGYARPPGSQLMGDGFTDPTLPPGIEAIWLTMFYEMPSLTIVVATFTLSETAGDLSEILRTDYSTKMSDIRIRVPGPFGRLRAGLPFGRPQLRGHSGSISSVDGQKSQACEALIRSYEQACWKWCESRFPGCFSQTELTRRPTVRLLFTRANPPFEDAPSWRRMTGLWPPYDVWRATGLPGWSFKIDSPYTVTAAACRVEAAKSPGGGDPGDSLWYLTQDFHDAQGALFARWSVSVLLTHYSERLAELRDRSARQRRIERPVSDAQALNRYLMTNGLDADTLVADITTMTEDEAWFAFDLPDYVQSTKVGSADNSSGFVRELYRSLQSHSSRLATSTETTTRSIVASAGLRQSIMNTKLQRRVVVISIAAGALGAISLAITLLSHSH